MVVKFVAIPTLLLLLFQSASAGCLEDHLRGAIETNLARRPLYSALTGGRSEPVSDRLIANERLALALGWLFSFRAKVFNRNGIPVLCDDLISMKNVPPFQERSERGPESMLFYQKIGGAEIARQAKNALRIRGYAGLAKYLEAELEILNQAPSFHCMFRHLVESVLRSATLAPQHIAAARQKNLPSPNRLILDFILVQIDQFEFATDLDELAAPIQAEGVPIICRDVPVIPY